MAFVDQGEFEAMKTMSGWEAARYSKHQFCAKIKVSAWAVFELPLFDSGLNKERKKTKNDTFATAHFCI